MSENRKSGRKGRIWSWKGKHINAARVQESKTSAEQEEEEEEDEGFGENLKGWFNAGLLKSSRRDTDR